MLRNIENYLSNSNNKQSHRSKSAYLMLGNIDEMLEDYKLVESTTKGTYMMKVFGLLQGLFVAVDSLYDLTIGITQNKYHININQNKVLHQLKYIRNDIVGHPTNRVYDEGKIGFSILNLEGVSYDTLQYKTFIHDKTELKVIENKVELKKLIDAYQEEQDIILKDLIKFLETKNEYSDLPEKIYQFYIEEKKEQLLEIKNLFLQKYGTENPNHRFLWRYNLILYLMDWVEEDKDFQQLIYYAFKKQIIKLYEISLSLENRFLKSPYQKVPSMIVRFYKFLDKNPKLVPYIEHLHDMDHPYFYHDLDILKKYSRSEIINKLLNFLEIQKDEKAVYLIGSLLKEYVKR